MKHRHIISLLDLFYHKQKLCLVFEFIDSTALQILEKSPNGIPESYVQRLMWQLLLAVEYLHSENILHRDIKPENLLVSSNGILKLCDFGFARRNDKPGHFPSQIYTSYVATRWYRAPELLLHPGRYDASVDIWAIGCLAAELLTGRPAFPGKTDSDQLSKILSCTGPIKNMDQLDDVKVYIPDKIYTVQDKYAPLCSSDAVSFLEACLQGDPELRPSALQLLGHPWIFNYKLNGLNEQFFNDQIKLEKDSMEKMIALQNLSSRVSKKCPISKPSSQYSRSTSPIKEKEISKSLIDINIDATSRGKIKCRHPDSRKCYSSRSTMETSSGSKELRLGTRTGDKVNSTKDSQSPYLQRIYKPKPLSYEHFGESPRIRSVNSCIGVPKFSERNFSSHGDHISQKRHVTLSTPITKAPISLETLELTKANKLQNISCMVDSNSSEKQRNPISLTDSNNQIDRNNIQKNKKRNPFKRVLRNN